MSKEPVYLDIDFNFIQPEEVAVTRKDGVTKVGKITCASDHFSTLSHLRVYLEDNIGKNISIVLGGNIYTVTLTRKLADALCLLGLDG